MTVTEEVAPQALAGLKVVECATVIAAPLAGRLLADFGAEVIHVEHPGTGDHLRQFGFTVDGINPWWAYYARNKKLVTLDISRARGRALLLRLVADADIFIENFRPGRLEQWGLGPDALAAVNPGLIVVRLTGFGQDGPYAGDPGFGSLAEAMSGFAEMTGQPDGPPTLPQFALADSFAAMYAAAAAMFALHHRNVNGGAGQVIDVSLWESLFAMLGPNAAVHALTGAAPTRIGNRAPTSAPRNIYPTADGGWVGISASTQAIAARLFRLIGRPELIDDARFDTNPHRVDNVAELDAIVAAWTRARGRADVIAALRAAEVPVGAVNNVADIAADPHAIARAMIVDAPVGDGRTVPQEGVFPKLGATPGRVRHAGGARGADNDEIFGARLGLDAAARAALASEGII